MKRRPPPFAKHLRDCSLIKIYTSGNDRCWELCKRWSDHASTGATLIPFFTAPDEIDWRVVRNKDVHVIQANRCPLDKLEILGRCLVEAGAASVHMTYRSGFDICATWYLQPGSIHHAAA